VRIVRPYETEEAFLEAELETVGKTSVILIGAHSRPTGVILRFEVTLATGATVLRGEGRVLAHKENAFRGQPGLALRFTRLDPKSKALVDRAAAIREARLSGDSRPPSVPPPPPPPPPPPSSPPPPPPPSMKPTAPPQPATASMPAPDLVLASILTSPTPPPPALITNVPPSRGRKPDRRRRGGDATSAPPAEHQQALIDEALVAQAQAHAQTTHQQNTSTTITAPALAPTSTTVAAPPISAEISATPKTRGAVVGGNARVIAPPPNRDDLLSRLRERASALSDEQKAAILRAPR
jgi:hypothetical protein